MTAVLRVVCVNSNIYACRQMWAEKAAAGVYDPTDAPVAQKRGLTLGMSMTEKQGGSDVQANTTEAVAADDGFVLTGHK